MSRARPSAARLLVALAALVAGASAARAACTAGAPTLRVPEDCATVAAAVAAIGPDGTIDVATGTAPLGPLPLDLSNLGHGVTLRARSAGATTFSGGGANPIVVIENSSGASGGPVVFEGIRFANGRSASGARSAGVTLLRAEATFADCRFEGNVHTGATTGGGALAVLGGSRALVARSTFDDNRARNNGGAIYAVRGAGLGPVSLWIVASDLTGNSTAEAGFTGTSAGGAIYARDAAVRIADSRFESNVAGGFGGAVYLFGNWGEAPACDFEAPAADLLVARALFRENRADDAADPGKVGQTVGGALHAEGCARVRIHASLLEENEADKAGAVALDHARLVAEQTIFRHNRARLGDTGLPPIGGALMAFTSEAGRPLGAVTLVRDLFEGGLPENAAAANAHHGGCVAIAGDASARRVATIEDSIFHDCNAVFVAASAPNVRGGGLYATRADLDLAELLLVGNEARGSGPKLGGGGGAALLSDTVAGWSASVLAGNEADNDDLDLTVTASSSTGAVEAWSEDPDPPSGVLLAAPSRPAGPGGPFAGEAALGFAWRGSGAELDGAPLGATEGVVAGADGAHELVVEGLASCSRCTASVLPPIEPSTTLEAAPEEIAGGGSATLSWTTPAGEPLAALVDRGVGETGASGSQPVSPEASATYRRFALTKQGGALAEARVWVDEAAPDVVFADGFEAGLGAWDELFL